VRRRRRLKKLAFRFEDYHPTLGRFQAQDSDADYEPPHDLSISEWVRPYLRSLMFGIIDRLRKRARSRLCVADLSRPRA